MGLLLSVSVWVTWYALYRIVVTNNYPGLELGSIQHSAILQRKTCGIWRKLRLDTTETAVWQMWCGCILNTLVNEYSYGE